MARLFIPFQPSIALHFDLLTALNLIIRNSYNRQYVPLSYDIQAKLM